MERGGEKNYTPIKPPKISSITQDDHVDVNFVFFKIIDRVEKWEI